MVQYSQRHADLVKYTVNPKGLRGNNPLLDVMHPLSQIRVKDVARRGQIPRHVAMTSKETLELFRVIEQTAWPSDAQVVKKWLILQQNWCD